MTWRIELDPAAAKELRKLGTTPARRIVECLSTRIAKLDDPRSLGEPLKGRLGELWQYRIGDYRLIVDIEDGILLILVVRVGHRREICKR
jgi:mRNA interferase RelE/StbE